eukprot:TRINITY_DN2469_c0_g3_i2.p1 TRINITY_DN2469_c0_g3~~TRINITY_DN2469_c0_g3_i2.p1  ORF type:complete len:183 (+),score=40.22 TRINITY_DN2469_c0_g3_i2:268-816(+)
MPGGSLFDLLYKRRVVPTASQRQVLALDVAKAMAYLHNCKPPIIHRDLKSANILLDERGERAKVGDVGLARAKSPHSALVGPVGTYAWMPPEMISGKKYDEKADVYSYGMVLFEMVASKPPFPGLTPTEITHKIVTLEERMPLPSNISSKWRALVTACWATDATTRPSFITTIDTLATINNK